MVGTFVLGPIQTRESRLVAWFPVRAGSAGVPVVDVEPTGETSILVGEDFYNVGVAGILGSGDRSSRGKVWNKLTIGGRSGSALTRGSTSTGCAGATATDLGARRYGWRSPLRHAEGGDGQRDDRPLCVCRGAIRRSRLHERELLHHARMVFITPGLVGSHVLDRCIKNSSVGIV